MATTSALETLVELATQETDEATKRLGRMVRTSEEAQQKMTILLEYREDYAVRFRESLAVGLTPMNYRNFQLFIEKIDTAIDGQKEIIKQAQERVVEARTVWQACERKRLTYDTLVTRAKQEKMQRENRLDQKQMDEYASRIAFYKR
jgi:flagellar FliJ protein